jgi:large subunit ribosomal protein L23
MDIYQVIKGPHITEKGNLQKELNNQISLKVHPKANKVAIRQAVQTILKKKVLEVKTINVRGKKRRIGRHMGKKADWKKAVVKLAPGVNREHYDS